MKGQGRLARPFGVIRLRALILFPKGEYGITLIFLYGSAKIIHRLLQSCKDPVDALLQLLRGNLLHQHRVIADIAH